MRQLQIVLEMDQLLVFSTLQKPDPEERIDIDYYVVRVSFISLVIKLEQNEETGGEIYVYKRPHMQEFITKLQEVGTVSVFTHK